MENNIPTWELLAKKMIWDKLSFVDGKKVLDYGSGYGITANHLAKSNDVIAIEPSSEMLKERVKENSYNQINGDIDELRKHEDESFDVIVCHCVLEYVNDKEEILSEFMRILKPNGYISLVKHNKHGRVMQMVVLLNNFDHAEDLLDGKQGNSPKYGDILYYKKEDIENWIPEVELISFTGIRTFWDLQQNQDIQKDVDWQSKMLGVEKKVSNIREYRDIAFFHHLIYRKKQIVK